MLKKKGRPDNLQLLGQLRQLPKHLDRLVEDFAPGGTLELEEYGHVCVAGHSTTLSTKLSWSGTQQL